MVGVSGPMGTGYTIGIDAQTGQSILKTLEDEKENLKREIRNTTNLMNVIDSCWTGNSKVRFVKVLEQTIMDIENVIDMSYSQLLSRTIEIIRSYVEAEKNITESM